MARFKLVVAYLGTDFCGWQRQPAVPTVQGTLEQALQRISGGQAIEVAGASRTDAGVHAEGQLAAFSYEGRLQLRDFARGLNALTPRSITIRSVEAVDDAFHPRFEARGKRYRYLVWCAHAVPPTCYGRAWWLRRRTRLDVEAMREAAAHLVGEHDFDAFRATDCEARTTRRRIDSVDVAVLPAGGYLEPTAAEDTAMVAIDVRGNAFLKNMVRIIAGTLVEVGQGRRSADSVAAALASRDRRQAGETAPPEGLTLVRVYLPGDADAPPPLSGSA